MGRVSLIIGKQKRSTLARTSFGSFYLFFNQKLGQQYWTQNSSSRIDKNVNIVCHNTSTFYHPHSDFASPIDQLRFDWFYPYTRWGGNFLDIPLSSYSCLLTWWTFGPGRIHTTAVQHIPFAVLDPVIFFPRVSFELKNKNGSWTCEKIILTSSKSSSVPPSQHKVCEQHEYFGQHISFRQHKSFVQHVAIGMYTPITASITFFTLDFGI